PGVAAAVVTAEARAPVVVAETAPEPALVWARALARAEVPARVAQAPVGPAPMGARARDLVAAPGGPVAAAPTPSAQERRGHPHTRRGPRWRRVPRSRAR
ncbi:MAG: hypothetical protein ACRDF1_06075, partial [bacterium]